MTDERDVETDVSANENENWKQALERIYDTTVDNRARLLLLEREERVGANGEAPEKKEGVRGKWKA